jgi:hypothetical protein
MLIFSPLKVKTGFTSRIKITTTFSKNYNFVLFSLFLNDLVEFISQTYDGLTNVYNATHIFLETEDISVITCICR